MVKVSVEVRSEMARFEVAAWAQSIKGAVSLVSTHFPGSEAKVMFPIDGEAFFAKRRPVPTSGTIVAELVEAVAR